MPIRHTAFPPIAGPHAEVLILGSFPGQRSLQARRYYAHPMNSFWRIMGRVLGTSFDVPYRERVQLLKRHRIALWDVVRSARRRGSLDSAIEHASVVPNDFGRFFAHHPDIRLVCFNGAKAAELYRRLVLPSLEIESLRYARLPSTSPAHAAMPFAKKLARWRVAGAKSRGRFRPSSGSSRPTS